MANEGVVISSSASELRSQMLTQLERLGTTDADSWEQAVFTELTGASRDDVDWDIEHNQAGYSLWIKAFDRLVQELIDDGFVRLVAGTTSSDRRSDRRFELRDTDPPVGFDRVAEAPVS
jgi:hypothetical protein